MKVDKQRVIELRRKGVGSREVAERMGISRLQVNHIMREAAKKGL